ncbi:hypothetical protein R77592_04497 [Ralstonia mannitolilytica]|uniref:helix-turn-helix transcriptional regulator n=1 Tax=Ralstonia mannitolilytica TaxID=105219 RepID=UPI0028F69F9F|nr:hypothetical protein [Ralstonia mannitolilytica]CAJ0738004.1 hypothetical protein R77592_04497 [Ralstonia mannitolilytica]
MTPTDFDSFSASQLIKEDLLSEWLDQPISTLQKWRVTGKGPKYVKFKNGTVRYQVGTIRHWIEGYTISFTTQALAERAKCK